MPARKRKTTKKKTTVVKRKAPARRAKKKASPRSSVTSINITNSPQRGRLNPYALGYSLAVLKGAAVLGISILGRAGKAQPAVDTLQAWMISYSLEWGGIIAGVAEAGVHGLVVGFLLAWLYNKFQ